MTLDEMKRKILSLIEEIDTKSPTLTGDSDIAAKLNYAINQVQYELSRIKKIPAYKEIEAKKDSLITFKDIKGSDENEVYQIDIVRGIEYEYKAQGTIIKVLEDGTAEIEYFKYPVKIDFETPLTYKFDLSDDVLECMPYGVAADLLKNDVSSNYGQIYAQRYEKMKQELDPRYNTGSIVIEGGFNV